MKYFLLILSIFFSTELSALSKAHAEEPVTLFVDINDSPLEIATVRKSAQGEVITIPTPAGRPWSNEELHELAGIAKANAEIRDLEASEKRLKDDPQAYKAKVIADATRKTQLDDQRNADRTELRKTLGHFPFTENEVKSQLSEALRLHPTMRLVVSGEHYDSHFIGEMGILGEDAIADVGLNHPEYFKSVKSIYGLGCYTGVKSVFSLWHDLMPNLNQMIGYNARGPSGSNGAGLIVLSKVLKDEDGLIKASNDAQKENDQKLLETATRNILRTTDTTAVVCTCSTCIGNKVGPFNLIPGQAYDDMKGCGIEGYGHVDEITSNLLRALPDTESPNNNLFCDVGHSRLRSDYDDMEAYQQCAREAKTQDLRTAFRLQSIHFYQLGAMVFFQNITSNFAQYNQADLQALSKIAKKHDLPILDLSQPMSCIGKTSPDTKMSRKTIIKWINSLGESTTDLSEEEKSCVNSMKTRMSAQLTLLKCIPPTWVREPDRSGTPEAPPTSSTCQGVSGRACDL